MEIQWPLVLFTLLTGMGGSLFLFVCVNEFKRFSQKDPFIPGLVSLLLAVVGGFASVLHLSHPERIMNALSHPASSIFIEAALIGLTCLFVIVFLIMVKGGNRGFVAKVCAVLGAACGLAISFMAGHSYVMIAHDTWNTMLLPLGYLGTALVMGAALYWAIACPDKDNGASALGIVTAVCGAIALLAILAYAFGAGAFDHAAVFYAVALICAAAVVVLGILGKKTTSRSGAVIALVVSVAAGLLYRVAMWVVGAGTYGFFS